MGATHVFNFGSTQRIEPNRKLSEWLLKRQSQQQIWTQMSLISLSLGFLLMGRRLSCIRPWQTSQIFRAIARFRRSVGSALYWLVWRLLSRLVTIGERCTRRSPMPETRRESVRLTFSPA